MKIKVSTILILVGLALSIAGFAMAFANPFIGNKLYAGEYVLSTNQIYFSNQVIKPYLPGFIAFIMLLVSGLVPLLLLVIEDKVLKIFVNITSIVFYSIAAVVILDMPKQFVFNIQSAATTAYLMQFDLSLSPTAIIAAVIAFIGIAINIALPIISNLDFFKTKIKEITKK